MTVLVALLVGTHPGTDGPAVGLVDDLLTAALRFIQPVEPPIQPWRIRSSTLSGPVGAEVPAVCALWTAVAPSAEHATALPGRLAELNERLCAASAARVVVHGAQPVVTPPGVPRTATALDAVAQLQWVRYECIVPLAALAASTDHSSSDCCTQQASVFEFTNDNYLRGSNIMTGRADAGELSASNIATARVLKRLKKACKLLTGRHDFGDSIQYGPITRCFCRGVLPDHGTGPTGACTNFLLGDADALLVLSISVTPPFLPTNRLMRLIGLLLATARHDSPDSDWRPEAWRNTLVNEHIDLQAAVDGVPAVPDGLYLAEAAYDFAEATLTPKLGPSLRLRVRPMRSDEKISTPVPDDETIGAGADAYAAIATSVSTFRVELQQFVGQSVQLASTAQLELGVGVKPLAQLAPEPEWDPGLEVDISPAVVPPEYAEAIAALRLVDSEGAWPAAPPHCRRRNLAVDNAGGELMVLGVDPDSGSWPFRYGALTAAERALPELTAVLRRLEAPLRRQAGDQMWHGASATMIVTRNAVLKPHRLQDLFVYGTGRSNQVAEDWEQEPFGSLALIVALGDFEGGDFLVSTTDPTHAHGDGTFGIQYNPRIFDGEHSLSSSMPFKGSRYTVAYFTPHQVRHAAAVARQLTPAPDQLAIAVQAGRNAASAARVAIVVPYRPAPGQSRERQLAIFCASLSAFLEDGCRHECRACGIDQSDGDLDMELNVHGVPKELGIFIIEQSADERRFNKGMLLNVAFDMLARDGWDTFCFSDVDVLPAATSSLLPWYITPPPAGAVLHFPFWHGNVSGFGAPSGGFLHCGVAMTKEQVVATNGFPNGYWGWGGEDDALRRRVESAGLEVLRPATPQAGELRDLEFELLNRRRGGSRASDPGCAAACRCPDKMMRHWQHDKGGHAPGSWREDGVAQLQGAAGLEADVRDGFGGHVRGYHKDLRRMIKKAVVRLSDVAPLLPEPEAVAEWRIPSPTVRCYLAAHPRLDRKLWTACVEPFVPRTMACHWMREQQRHERQSRDGCGHGDAAGNVMLEDPM